MIAEAIRIAIALIKRFEGLYLLPYLCPAGIPTIGYGATYYLDGRRVTLADPPITALVAEIMLREMVEKIYLPAVLRLCPNIAKAEHLALLIDFAFNLGVGRLQASTLRRRVAAGQWDLVAVELRKWVLAAGKKLRGLVLRREAEIALI
jgi:lysozyme